MPTNLASRNALLFNAGPSSIASLSAFNGYYMMYAPAYTAYRSWVDATISTTQQLPPGGMLSYARTYTSIFYSFVDAVRRPRSWTFADGHFLYLGPTLQLDHYSDGYPRAMREVRIGNPVGGLLPSFCYGDPRYYPPVHRRRGGRRNPADLPHDHIIVHFADPRR